MENHFLLSEMYTADDYSFLDQHQQMSCMINGLFEANMDEDLALGLLEDNFTNGEINSAYPCIPITSGDSSNARETSLSNSSLERPAKQSRRSPVSNNNPNSVVSNENMEPPSENPAPSPLLSSNDSTPSKQEAEKPKSKCSTRGQSHIMAERMRRERLTERFIALSALIPGLKKNDKGSVLCEAIKYVKQLQQRVNLLEEQNKRLSGARPSVVLVKNSSDISSREEDVSNISSDSATAHGNSNNNDRLYESLPEVEARVFGKEVIIRIHCRKHKDVLMNILRELENFHVVVVNSNVIPFGNSSFVDITIVAQLDKEDHTMVNVLAKNIGFALPGPQ